MRMSVWIERPVINRSTGRLAALNLTYCSPELSFVRISERCVPKLVT